MTKIHATLQKKGIEKKTYKSIVAGEKKERKPLGEEKKEKVNCFYFATKTKCMGNPKYAPY